MDLPVQPGEHVLAVVRPGYQTQSRSFKVDAGGTVGPQVELQLPFQP